MPDLSAFTALRHLELSYNAIRSLAPLSACGATGLQELYAASNKITEVRAPSPDTKTGDRLRLRAL